MTIRTDRFGFTLIEVIVAMMILSFGVLAMGASTGYLMRQVNDSAIRSERVGAMRDASEGIRAAASTQAGWNQLSTTCGSGALDVSTPNFTVTCSAPASPTSPQRVQLIITPDANLHEPTDTSTLSIVSPT